MTGEERRQLDLVVALVHEVLGEDALGASLFGSATLGGLRAESDLDVLVVAARPLSPAAKRRLGDGLLELTGRPRRLELTVTVPPGRRTEFQYGDWLRAAFERGRVEPEHPGNPDLAVLVATAQRHGRPLFGDGAAALAPVTPDELSAAATAGIAGLLDELDTDTRNVLLTLARVWCTRETGAIRSKDEAAAWALERLPQEQREPLARARAIYRGEAEEHWDDLRPALRAHAEHVVAAIEG